MCGKLKISFVLFAVFVFHWMVDVLSALQCKFRALQWTSVDAVILRTNPFICSIDVVICSEKENEEKEDNKAEVEQK